MIALHGDRLLIVPLAVYGTAAASDMPTAAANNVGRTMARRKLIGYHQG